MTYNPPYRGRRARKLMLALSLLATTAFAQNVRQLDALELNRAVNPPQSAQPVQIRTLSQSAHQRALPRVLALPELMNAKAALAAPAPGRPLQIGVARALPDAADAAATNRLLAWARAADGSQRAAISVRAPGAKGLRLGLRVDQLPQGARLRVYAPDAAQTTEVAATEVLRTIQTNLNAGDRSAAARTYWLPMVEGAEAALEIELPAGVDPAQLKVSLPAVSHLTMLPSSSEATMKAASGGSCNVDVMCTSGNENEMRAVALMNYVDGGDPYVCTGTLLNNSKNDGTPYFLSANHCISNQTVASTLETEWNFRSASCGGGQDSNYQKISGGAQLLYNSKNTDTLYTDTAFMRLNASPPANAMFAGWDASTPAAGVGTPVFSIHHPLGMLQEYSEGAVSDFATCTGLDSSGYFKCPTLGAPTLGNNTFYNVTWSDGSAQEGSSGSALFTRTGRRVIGQFYGGAMEWGCHTGERLYGRFDLAYNTALYKWLGSTNNVNYTVTPSVNGGNGIISPATPVMVNSGATYSFTVTPNAGYTANVGGTCGGSLSGNTYTTNPVNANCTVVANFTLSTAYYTVTASAGAGGTISPSGNISVASGKTQAFTVTPNTGYVISSVGGTCGVTSNGSFGGSLSGTYTTKPITGDCTVVANFTSSTAYYTVTASAGAGGTISPSGNISVASGKTQLFTVTPNAGYAIASVDGCGAYRTGSFGPSDGSSNYSTSVINGNCTVVASFRSTTAYYTVTASAGAGGTISPSGSMSVAAGKTQLFTVTPNAGYAIASVDGCGAFPTGSFGPADGSSNYSTSVISGNCTVVASFKPNTVYYTVTANAGVGGTISPSGSTSVASGRNHSFLVTPNAGYAIASVGGTCGAMAIVGFGGSSKPYMTHAITSNCTIEASFRSTTAYYTVTAIAGAGGTISPSGSLSTAAGTTRTFTVTPNAGYVISSAGGTCGVTPRGSFGPSTSGTYITNAINADCTVVFYFR